MVHERGHGQNLLRTPLIVSSMGPRVLRPGPFEQRVLVYTDGAFESGVGTWGAVMVDRAGNSHFLHRGRVPQAVLDCWHDRVGGDQVICQVEIYAFLIFLYHCKEYFSHRPVIA